VDEVGKDDLMTVNIEQVTTVSAASPPEPFDVRELAWLRTNEYGHAEWVIAGGPEPRSAAIPSDQEKQEVDERAKARRAADAEVDWTRSRLASRPPDLVYSDAEGCGNAFVFGWSADRTEAITVRAGVEELQLSTAPQSFDLAAGRAGLEVVVHVHEQPVHRWPFCTDVIVLDPDRKPPSTWRAVGGTITIELSPPGIRAEDPFLRRATMRIAGAEFVGPGGTRVKQGPPIILTGIVGWFAG
jgi:hypothetical protein